MTEAQTRKKSALSDEDMWTVPAVPTSPAAVAPEPAVAPAPPAAAPPPLPVATTPSSEPTRDIAEARGRNRVRSAIFAWAAAERKAAERLEECWAVTAAALDRGTDPAVLRDFAIDACQRHGVALDFLPAEFRSAIGLSVQ
ncbi:Uncharacterised protein [Mycobacteroides abscessus subsp. abscessus]|nr:Uncharacterised protein [Mycobacteroides abscessus subsp. abscessus]